uniref:Oxysterol-binding protein n=1 Tax=Elaeophora elaphi TaxID=1147741 RepID=A0A0R3RXB9_9BILA
MIMTNLSPAESPLQLEQRSFSAANGNENVDDRKINLKKQKREYRDEKKRVTRELLTTLHDPTIVVMADWLKVRGTLRKWNRYFCILKPGLLLVYKSNKVDKPGHWIGTVLLNNCELIERPSKKDGFCFKLFHPMDQSIWATRGPLGESHGVVTIQPLPTTYLICRAPSEQAGGCWMDALHLTLRCSGLLMRTMCKISDCNQKEEEAIIDEQSAFGDISFSNTAESSLKFSEIEAEKHFDGLNDDIDRVTSDSGDETIGNEEESSYIQSDPEQFGSTVQVEDLADENKSLMWSLLKQVRPGMDLSKVTLPTFILEPRSFLEKLADFYYHSYIIAEATAEDDPLQRMKTIVKFYLSGFYKKPKGLKKPYNPILGETFRCKWEHPDNSTSYYVAEQVSHHPPVSALFLTNRKAGFNISGTILAKSKYYGNSLSAMMIGDVRITLLQRGETYVATLPYANCKGIMIGTLSMEYGGQVRIECNRTDYVCELDFKLKPFIGGTVNLITGDIKCKKESVAHIEGAWDGEIYISEKVNINVLKHRRLLVKQDADDVKTLLWSPTPDVIAKRLKRYEILLEEQGEWESKKLWLKVSEAIAQDNQKAATEEKSKLEDEQRSRAKSGVHHKPKWFKQDLLSKNYEYIHADYQAWDENDDIRQIEYDYVIRTKTKHGTKERSASPPSSASVQQEQSEDSDSPGNKRYQQKKRRHSLRDFDRLQQVQDTLDRTVQLLQRLETNFENRANVAVTQQQLIFIMAFFIIFHVIVLPLFVGSLRKL